MIRPTLYVESNPSAGTLIRCLLAALVCIRQAMVAGSHHGQCNVTIGMEPKTGVFQNADAKSRKGYFGFGLLNPTVTMEKDARRAFERHGLNTSVARQPTPPQSIVGMKSNLTRVARHALDLN